MLRGKTEGDQDGRGHGPIPFLQKDRRNEPVVLRVGEVPRLVHQDVDRGHQPPGGDVPEGRRRLQQVLSGMPTETALESHKPSGSHQNVLVFSRLEVLSSRRVIG